MKVAITGSLGFLGTHLLATLTKQQNSVLALARGRDPITRYIANCDSLGLPARPEKITFLECDITKQEWGLTEEDRQKLNSAELLIHAAGDMNALKSAEELYATNTAPVAFFTTLDIPRIVHISTLAVFVSSDWNRNNTVLPKSPIAGLKWTNGYAESKAGAEAKIKGMDKPITIIRPSHIYADIMPRKDLYLRFTQAMRKLNCVPESIPLAEINTVSTKKVIKDILASKPGEIIHSFGKNQLLYELTNSYAQVTCQEFAEKVNKLPPIERIIIRNSFFRPPSRWKELDIFLSTGFQFSN